MRLLRGLLSHKPSSVMGEGAEVSFLFFLTVSVTLFAVRAEPVHASSKRNDAAKMSLYPGVVALVSRLYSLLKSG